MRMKDGGKEKDNRRGNTSKDILRLLASGIIMGTAADAMPDTRRLFEYLDPKDTARRKTIWNAIHYLERHGDLELERGDHDRDFIHITDQGRIRFNEDQIWDM